MNSYPDIFTGQRHTNEVSYPDDTDPVDFVFSANMSRWNLAPAQRAMVTAALPKLKWGDNQHMVEVGNPTFRSVAARAARAGVHRATQLSADYVYAHGDEATRAKVLLGGAEYRLVELLPPASETRGRKTDMSIAVDMSRQVIWQASSLR